MLFLATIGVNFYVTAEAAKPRYTSPLLDQGSRTRASNWRLRLFSADSTLDPLALAPGGFGTEAMYTPPDSSTLPE
jgi:hypothetical protein